MFNTVMRANPVGMRMNHYLAQAGLAPVIEIADVVTCFWPTWLGKIKPHRHPVYFQAARASDFPAMAALWRTFASGRQLARAYEPTEWQASLRLPPLPGQNWVLAWQGDELKGFVGIWDQRIFRQVQLLQPSALLRLIGWRPGQALPVGHCFHLCLPPASRRILPGLLHQALRQASDQGLGLLSLALDAQDPLLEWLPKHLVSLGSFGRMHLCSNQSPRRPRPYHLEMALG